MRDEMIWLYHMGLDFVAKASVILNKEELRELQFRFLEEAKSCQDSRNALRSLADICGSLVEEYD